MKLVRFYQQYKLNDFLEMDIATLSIFIKAMNQIEAEEQLFKMDSSIYPHMGDKDRRLAHKKWYKIAYPENFEQRTVKTTDLELF
jgi:hypothetical protein